MPVEVSAPIDTHEMVVVHRMFRRESRLLAELVAACEPGDRARCRVLVDHLRDYCLALHLHHSAEDELLWPKLLARLDQEADVVLRMEAAHERISSTLDVVTAAADAWEATPGEPERDALVAALVDQRAVLVAHLDDEEAALLPLAARHLTAAEWDSQGEHAAGHTPKAKLLRFFGMALEDAEPAERQQMLGHLPAPARVLWYVIGRAQYARYVRKVRG